MTHQERLKRDFTIGTQRPNIQPWKRKHEQVMNQTRPVKGRESLSIAGMVWLLAQYADEHQKRFGIKLGDDGVLGPAWKGMVENLITLLNGDLGDLDGGSTDKALRTMLKEEGFDEAE